MKVIRIQIAILTLLMLSAAFVFGQEQQPTPESTPETQVQQTNQNSDSTPVEPKKDGVVRIGIVAPKVQLGQSAEQDASESVRQLFSSYLNGVAIETISIESKTPSQITIEAQQKECDFILYSSVSQKQKTSLFGNFVKIAVPVLVSSIPTPGNVTAGGQQGNVISGAAQQSAQTMTNAVSNSVKAKDVITLEFVLASVSNPSTGIKKALKGKADSDGQDVITPLIEQASAAIAETVIKK